MALCRDQGFLPPRYDYEVTQEGRYVAIAVLANGRKFTGVPCSSKEAASENVAKLTLYQMVSKSMDPCYM